MYAPFTIPERDSEGRLVRVDNPEIQFGMIDSGAMVGCVSHAVLATFPALQQYFIEKPDHLSGMGSIKCAVFGELRNVPINLGTQQEKGNTALVNFRVTEGAGYQVIFGLDYLVGIKAWV